jgi:hypothetical protein
LACAASAAPSFSEGLPRQTRGRPRQPFPLSACERLDFQNGLGLLQRVLVQLYRKPDRKDDLVLEIRKKYLELLKTNLKRPEPAWSISRNEIMDVLERVLGQKELRELFWNIWEELVDSISDSDDYEAFTKPYALFFAKQDYEFKESPEERLFELMNSTKPEVRRRAGSLHHILFPES